MAVYSDIYEYVGIPQYDLGNGESFVYISRLCGFGHSMTVHVVATYYDRTMAGGNFFE